MYAADLCRHIKSNGIQCHAVALTDSVFCYFHNRLNQGHRLYRTTMVGKQSLLERGHIIGLPALEDRLSVQLAISEVVNALACNFIDAKRANALFFGLKLASANAKGLETISQPTQVVRDCHRAPDILDSVSVDIAPPGRTCDIDDSNDPAIFQNPGVVPGTYNQRTVTAHQVELSQPWSHQPPSHQPDTPAAEQYIMEPEHSIPIVLRASATTACGSGRERPYQRQRPGFRASRRTALFKR
jgi:hypothetical protein